MLLRRPALGFLVIIFSLTSCFAYSEPLREGVHTPYVVDGDTLSATRESGERISVRFAGIDCPERDQPGGTAAKKALASVVSQADSTELEVMTKDRYGRLVARVFADGHDVNRWLVREGYCYVYHRYANDKQLAALEESAKIRKVGVWALPDAERILPWDWRHR